MKNREIEVRFLGVKKNELIEKLLKLGAKDQGEDVLQEAIFYDKEGKWQYVDGKFVRIRKTKQGVFVAFKHKETNTATGTKEVEFQADDFYKIKDFLEEVGLIFYREQEKNRHKFVLEEVVIDIDTWPSIPTYVELEGLSEEALKNTARLLELDWSKAVFGLAHEVIESYGVPVRKLKYFTFDKIE